MRCNGLPNTDEPSDLRRYIYQWQMDAEERNRNARNWLLEAEERSLLAQDVNAKVRTRSVLKQQQENLGHTYAKRLKEVLQILSELNESLADDRGRSGYIHKDLVNLRTEIRLMFNDHLNDFAYNILSQIDRDMEIAGSGVRQHIYSSDVFKSFIWTFLKDAEILPDGKCKNPEENQHTEIEFPTLDIQLSLPPTVNLYDSSLKALWLICDHYSDYCNSFHAPEYPLKDINMLTHMKREWGKRKQILKDMLAASTKDLPNAELELYEHGGGEFIIQTEKQKRKHQDIDKIYLEYEEQMNKLRRKALGPERYNLLGTDVNLRKYRIIGGVYCLDFLEIPQQDVQLNSNCFIRTTGKPKKLEPRIYYQSYKPPPPPQPGVRRLPEEIEAEIRMVEKALDKLAQVTVQLPDTILWFEPPIPCRWETQKETEEADLADSAKQLTESTDKATADISSPLPFTDKRVALKAFQPDYGLSRRRKKSSQKSLESCVPIKEIKDFNLLELPPSVDLYTLLNDIIIPRLPLGYHLYFGPTKLCQKLGRKYRGPPKFIFLARPKPKVIKKFLRKPTAAKPLRNSYQMRQKSYRLPPKQNTKQILGKCLELSEPHELFIDFQFENLLKVQFLPDDKLKVPKTMNSILAEGKRRAVAPQRTATSKFYMLSDLMRDLEDSCEVQLARQRDMLQQINERLAAINISLQPTDSRNEGEATAANDGGDGGDVENPQELMANLENSIESTQVEEDNDDEHQLYTIFDDNELDDIINQQLPAWMDSQRTKGTTAAATTVSITAEVIKQPPAAAAAADDDGSESSSVDDFAEEIFESEDAWCLPATHQNSEIPAMTHTTENDGRLTNRSAEADSTDSGRSIPEQGWQGEKDTSAITTSKSSAIVEGQGIQGKWSTRDIHDVKFNEDKLSIQFRTGRLGTFGFALNRYSNMPYQAWDLRPDVKSEGAVLLNFTASLISLDISITADGYCLKNFQGGSTATITDMIGRIVTFDELQQMLIASGADIFPELDAFCYIEGTCEKNYVMEMHLYACMSTLGLSHNFSWSRWNLLAGSRIAILLIRELIEGKKMPKYSTLLVTPLKTAIIDCTEVSANFSAASIEGLGYYADLYQLAKDYAQPSSLEKQYNMNSVLRYNIETLLKAIRPLSFC